MKKVIFISFILASLLYPVSIDKSIEVGIDEKLGQIIPLDIEFYNSDGIKKPLSEFFDTPVLMNLVYFECPGICSPLINELAWTVDRLDMIAGVDYKILSISIADRETPELAARWKKSYMESMRKKIPEDSWLFLTGDLESIQRLADAVGYHFIKSPDSNYVHPGALIAVSENGMISRYLFGDTYNQFDVKLALIDAKSGKSSPTIAKVLKYCFSYDPEGRSYTLNITRIIGTVMLLSVGIFLMVLLIRKKKNSKE